MRAYNDPTDYNVFIPTAADYERAEGHVFRIAVYQYNCPECGHEFHGPETCVCPVCECDMERGALHSTIVIHANNGEVEVFDGREPSDL